MTMSSALYRGLIALTMLSVVALNLSAPQQAFASSTNVSLFKPASASTVLSTGYSPEKGNDNDVTSGWSPTGSGQPRLVVDLMDPYEISRIEVVTRQGADQVETRRNFEIWASNTSDMSNHVVLGTQGSNAIAYQATWAADVSLGTSYRYVAFVKTVPEYAFVAELRVFSSGSDKRTADTDWMSAAKYGVFIHHLPGVNDITTANWNDTVNAFNVDTFANQMSQAGAAYVIFTIGQNSGYYNSPNATYNQITGYQAGDRTSTRDLPMELADALAAKGIRLVLYLPAGAPENDATARSALGWTDNLTASQAFQAKWESVIREWSLRYGTKVSGWWFDGAFGQSNYTDYTIGARNYTTFAAAAKAGNSEAVVAFNPGVGQMVNVSNSEDYTAGELDQFDQPTPSSRFLKAAQIHHLSYLGNWWGQTNTRYSNQFMIDYVSRINSVGGAVTMDVGIFRNGTIGAAQLEQLSAIKTAIRGAAAGDVDDASSSLSYSGSWLTASPSGSDYQQTVHYSNVTGASAELTFTGTSVSWYGVKRNDHGKADVYIDNVLQATVDAYSTNEQRNTLLFSVAGLGAGSHTIKIVVRSDRNAASSNNWVAVDRIALGAAAGDVDDASSSLSYSGSWLTASPSGSDYQQTVHYSNVTGASAELTFTGTSVSWYGVKRNDHGKADVYIDNVLQATVDAYSTNEQRNTLLFSVAGLGAGSHTIKIVVRSDRNAASSNNWVAVDRIALGAAAGDVDDASSSLSYSGSWLTASPSGSDYQQTVHYSNVTGASAELTFTGTSVSWYGVKRNDHGKADVYIDNVLQATVDAYSTNELRNTLLFSVAGLGAGSHTIKIVVRSDRNAASSNNWVAVDRINSTI